MAAEIVSQIIRENILDLLTETEDPITEFIELLAEKIMDKMKETLLQKLTDHLVETLEEELTGTWINNQIRKIETITKMETE